MSPPRPAPTAGLVGRSVPRPDVPSKLDGTFEFSNDVTVPGMLHGATVRSPHPRARVLGVDGAAARHLPGVVAVLTAADVPGARRVGHLVADQPVLAEEEVRYHGEPVAFVVAATPEQARRAVAAVEVAWEVLEPVTDPEAVLAGSAPSLHPDGNLLRHLELRRGEPSAPAAVEVRGVWRTGRQDQAFLGPESAVAVPDPDGGVTLHLATQDLHTDRHQIAAALALPEEKVRLVLSGVGGAFGGREDITCQVHLALAALALGRPVGTTLLRSESFLAHPQRHPARIDCAIGADTDGTLRWVRAHVLLDGGAYASTSGPVLGSACYFAAGPYRVPSVEIVGDAVRTNNPVSGAMRGFGAVQACFAVESTMDLLAARLGMDPVELRRRNALRPGDPFPTSGQPFDATVDVAGLLDRCAALPMPGEPSPDDPYGLPGGTGRPGERSSVRRGVGVALGVKNHLYGEGVPEHSVARVVVGAAGAVVHSAATECGQGITSVLAQVASDALGGLPVRVEVATSDAGYAGSSSASRQTWMASGAVLAACGQARDRLAARAVARLGARAEGARLRGAALELGDGERVPLADLLGSARVEGEGRYEAPPTERGDPTHGQGDVHVSWMVVAHRAVVDVDVELGLARVVQVATAQDVGRALNPREVRGQIAGGIAQGVGLALTEELLAPGGVVRNGSFADYLPPTAADVPELEVDLVERPDPRAPLGLRGVGEPPALSSTAAVAAALRRATGRPVTSVPARPADLVAGGVDPSTLTRAGPTPDRA